MGTGEAATWAGGSWAASCRRQWLKVCVGWRGDGQRVFALGKAGARMYRVLYMV